MIKDYELKKAVLLNDQDYCCASCSEPFESGQKIDLSHKLVKSKSNIKLYGIDLIDHIDNLAATHSNGYKGKACNDSMIINRATQPMKADEHIKKIKRSIENGK